MNAFDVRIHAIRRRPDRRRPFEVRWHAGGRARSRSFITRGLADSYRAELIRAARQGLDFSPATGELVFWDTPEPATTSWLQHAAACAAMNWHQARAAAIPGQEGTQPARRPYDLRHAALSLWLSSGAPPAEVAARAGHSVRVLLTIYAHCIPGCGQIASQHIEQALRASHWPPAGSRKSAWTPGIPSVMRPRHSWTQPDAAGSDTNGHHR